MVLIVCESVDVCVLCAACVRFVIVVCVLYVCASVLVGRWLLLFVCC